MTAARSDRVPLVLPDLAAALDASEIGERIYALAAELFPICRSITGNGVRETLAKIAEYIDLEVHEVASGTAVLDWIVPPEWNLRRAYIADSSGRRVIDTDSCNLHVMSYSVPVRTRVSLGELKSHVFTLPEQPTLIPYRTSYYAERWAFCMSHEHLTSLPEGEYEVVIDADLASGSLSYGEYLHEGASRSEVLLSAHICHPSLANDNCSGLALLTWLAHRLKSQRTRLSYRFLFAPGTIGAVTWLARAGAGVERVQHGLVVSCVGDAGGPTYKRSRRGNALVDRAMAHALAHGWPEGRVVDFSPFGYDERQFCSPGFDLAVGLFQRSQYGAFPEYHTSADNLNFIAPKHLASSYRTIVSVLDMIEADCRPVSLCPYGEPQLGRRGLYESVGGDKNAASRNMARLWVLNLADGRHSLIDMAERSGLPFGEIRSAAAALEAAGLLRHPD